MKTVFKNGVYDRVDNEVAETRVKNQGWKFVPKSEWKTNARPKPTEKSLVEEENKISFIDFDHHDKIYSK